MQILEAWRMRYERVGGMPIPLWSNSKRPVCDAWQHTPIAQQWLDVSASFKGNIGLVMGHGNAAIDGDDPRTVANIQNGLAALGLDVPRIETATLGHQHFYIRVVDVPSTFNWARLSPEVGPGELRAQNAYIVAPCSAIDRRRYKFVHGMIEDIKKLRPVSWKDLHWLLTPTACTSSGRAVTAKIEALPVRLVWREMNDRARILFDALKGAAKGKPVDRYPTRHEAEAAIVANLILCGWSFDEIAAEFETRQPGHWREHKRRDDYMQLTYRKVLTDIASTPERMPLTEMYQAADQAAWPGRGGGLERKALMSLISKGWQFSSYDVRCAQREMTEHGAASRKGLAKATERLQGKGLIEQRDHGTAEHGSLYTLKPDAILSKVAISHIPTQGGGGQENGGDVEVAGAREKILSKVASISHIGSVTNGDLRQTAVLAELWGYSGLGTSAGMVYRWLNDDVISIGELMDRTGKSQRTVYRALDALAEFELAEKVGDGWRRGKAQPAKVAKDLRCDEAAKRRRIRNEHERESWRRARQAVKAKQDRIGQQLSNR